MFNVDFFHQQQHTQQFPAWAALAFVEEE